MSALPQTVGYASAAYAATFAQPGSLIFPQFYFPAWRVLVDGQAAPARAVSPLGLLAVDVGAGTHTITLAWRATTAVWVGRMLSAVGWAVVLWLLVLWWRTGSAPEHGQAGTCAGQRSELGCWWVQCCWWVQET